MEELVEWAETHTEGGYGDHPSGKSQEPPEIVINQCYANPKGLNWEELAAIETLEDGRIGDRCAKKVLKYMPKTKQVHERKPPEELENDRFFMSVEKVLRTIYELQREQEEKGEPVTLKVDELAEKSGVSRGTLTNRINPSLNELQIKTKYSNRPNKFNLTQGKYPYKTYTFIRRGMYNSSKDTKVALWYSRFPEEFGRFKGLLDEINEWVKEVNGEKAENRADQIADPEDLELDPELKGHIKMAKQHGWEEVKAVLAHNDKNVKRVKQAIEKYAPEVEL